MTAAGQAYYVVQTKPNCEEYARRFLAADAFQVYFPRVLARRAHAGKIDYVPRPFFSRYIFIAEDGRSPFYFRSSPGIASVLTNAGVPVLVGQDVVDGIKSRENKNGYIELDDPFLFSHNAIKNGDPVRVHKSRFVSFDGFFSRRLHMRKGEDRAEVLISMLGRVTKQIVKLSDLEAL